MYQKLQFFFSGDDIDISNEIRSVNLIFNTFNPVKLHMFTQPKKPQIRVKVYPEPLG